MTNVISIYQNNQEKRVISNRQTKKSVRSPTSKMRTIGYFLGVSKQIEVLIMALIGICVSIFDTSLLDVNFNLNQAWTILIDPKYVSLTNQLLMKYVISGVILVQAFSLHVYLAFYIVMLWPLVCEDKPALLLPWLTVGAIKNICTFFTVLFLGSYICAAYAIRGVFKPICADFLLSQFVKFSPSIYMWLCVFSYYRELKNLQGNDSLSSISLKTKSEFQMLVASKRKWVRSLTHHESFDAKADDGRNLISESTIRTLMQQLTSKCQYMPSRSLDTMLQIIEAEAEQEKIMTDEFYDDYGEDVVVDNLSVKEKAMKVLKLTENDIKRAKTEVDKRKAIISSDMNMGVLNSKDLTLDRTMLPELYLKKFSKSVSDMYLTTRANEMEKEKRPSIITPTMDNSLDKSKKKITETFVYAVK